MDGYSMGGGFGGVGMIFWWILLVLVIAAVFKWFIAPEGASKRTQSKTALEILDERYARGEIDDEEYQRRKRELSS
ncbi:MAG: SHOCT domain-containing protein [Gammaproteobacteria bacterium]|nr:SHOCT domain-containing protein [Gammaproteobacteria bacterium]